MSKGRKFDRQHDRANWFVTTSNLPEQITTLKQTCKEFKRWFWIDHIPDVEDGKDHIHVMVMYSGSCLVKTAAKLLQVPEHMVQPCSSHKSYGRYLIHKDNPEKHQYSPSDVHTNYPGLYKSMLIDHVNDDIDALFANLKKLRNGSLSLSEFSELHRYELQNMPFYQKIKTYEYLEKISVRTT